ncbi:MAG: hypothetical protein JWM86_2531 [Thermoleophilia bacterium]|nr:hypothetical protein [Thermoleophilia bacterium]
MRRILVMLGLAAMVTLAAAAPASANVAAARTSCATEVTASGASQRWCNVRSTAYPQTKGWYGYVGLGGGPCNSNPRGTNFDVGLVGICSAPAPTQVWRYTAKGWVSAYLQDGTRGYVHPFDASWRWIYVDGQWYAIAAADLTLEWQVS